LLLSAYMISFRLYQESGVTLDTRGTRAYSAARAGAEWGTYNSLRNNVCAGPTTLALGASLSEFTVVVACTSAGPFNEAGVAVTIDTIVSIACNRAPCPQATPDPNYVERQLTFTVAR
jgi:MSHA biogenesis protein MshP